MANALPGPALDGFSSPGEGALWDPYPHPSCMFPKTSFRNTIKPWTINKCLSFCSFIKKRSLNKHTLVAHKYLALLNTDWFGGAKNAEQACNHEGGTVVLRFNQQLTPLRWAQRALAPSYYRAFQQQPFWREQALIKAAFSYTPFLCMEGKLSHFPTCSLNYFLPPSEVTDNPCARDF